MARKHLYSFITIGVLCLLLGGCASQSETAAPAAPTDSAALAETIARADALYKQREDPANLREAVRLLGAIRNPDHRNFETEWKFAKYNYFLGRRAADAKEAETAFEEGKKAGRIAARIEPEKPDGYFWFAANLGEQAKESPITVGIKSVDDIREAMNKVIELQPDYQGASAYDALAQVEMSTRLTGGKAEKAVEYLEKALELEKQNLSLRVHLAEAYFAAGRRADAKKQLELVLQMQSHPDFMLEHREVLEKAKNMLEKKF